MTDLTKRIVRYAKRTRDQKQRWPTVAETARALKVRQQAIHDEAQNEPCPFFLTSLYTVHPMPLGEHWIEVEE